MLSRRRRRLWRLWSELWWILGNKQCVSQLRIRARTTKLRWPIYKVRFRSLLVLLMISCCACFLVYRMCQKRNHTYQQANAYWIFIGNVVERNDLKTIDLLRNVSFCHTPSTELETMHFYLLWFSINIFEYIVDEPNENNSIKDWMGRQTSAINYAHSCIKPEPLLELRPRK